MADLTGKTIANGYPNLVTIGATTDDNPTTGQLENGKGTAITEIGVNKTPTAGIEFDVNGEIRASGGILFGSDTASGNTLGDYEEGTWTPLYTSQTGAFTTMTMNVVSATYTKIGRQVTVRSFIRTDEVVIGSATGILYVSGLPFTSAASNGGWSAVSIGYVDDWGSNTPGGGYVNTGATTIQLFKSDKTTGIVVGDLTTGASIADNIIIVTATYFV